MLLVSVAVNNRQKYIKKLYFRIIVEINSKLL